MANFAVAASAETIEKANKVMELYTQEGDKKEDTLLRILDLAESESVKGTHPGLEPALRSVDSTIVTLIKQVNGIVAGQDSQIADLTGKLNAALEEKKTTVETAKAQMDAAAARAEAAEAAIKQAAADSEHARAQAQAEIDAAKKDAAAAVEKANIERNQAVRERDDARTISEEKTANSDLLMRQMTAMEADVAACKALQENHEKLKADFSSLQTKLAEKEREIADTKKDAEAARKSSEADFIRRLELSKAQADLAVEKAVNAAEKNVRDQMQAEIRKADRENAKLAAQVEQLQAQVTQLTAELAKKGK